MIINWKRPKNVKRIVEAFHDQSETDRKIVLVDCAPHKRYTPDRETLRLCDEVFRWRHDLSPASRFVAGFMHNDCKYTYMHDDDAIPGTRTLELYKTWASKLKEEYSVLGVQGRNFSIKNRAYVKGRIDLIDDLTKVDTTIRFHWTRTQDFGAILDFKWKIINEYPRDTEVLREDDLLLNVAIQQRTGKPAYLVKPPDSSYSSREQDVKSKDAHSDRDFHYRNRDRFVDIALNLGWARP